MSVAENTVPRLKHNAVGIWGTYGQAMAVTAPLGSVVSSLAAGALFAGANLPLVTLLAFLTSVAWIYLLTRFNRKINSAGGFYTYTSNSLGGRAGYVEAVTEFLAFLFTTTFEGMYVGIIVPSLMSLFGLHLPTWSWIPFTFLGIGLAIPLSYTDIAKTLSRYVAVTATAEVALLVGLGVFFIIHAGVGNTLSVFTNVHLAPRGLSGLATGYLLAVISIAGAGTATYLGEEAKSPAKSVSRGMWLAVMVGGLSMVLSSYSLVVAWGVPNAATLANADAPIVKLTFGISSVLAMFLVIMAVNSLLVSNVGTNISASRILFSLARERGLPSVFAKVHQTHRTPVFSTLFVGAASLLIAFIFPLFMGFQYAYYTVSVAASICWILGRLGDSISLPLFYFRNFRSEFSLASHVLAPVLITLVNMVGLGMSVFPISYPTDISVGFTGFLILLWVGAYFLVVRGDSKSIGSLIVDEEGRLLVSGFMNGTSVSQGQKT